MDGTTLKVYIFVSFKLHLESLKKTILSRFPSPFSKIINMLRIDRLKSFSNFSKETFRIKKSDQSEINRINFLIENDKDSLGLKEAMEGSGKDDSIRIR